jgi:hypothetical protein
MNHILRLGRNHLRFVTEQNYSKNFLFAVDVDYLYLLFLLRFIHVFDIPSAVLTSLDAGVLKPAEKGC